MLDTNPEKPLIVGMVLERIARDMMGEDVPEELIEWLKRTPSDILLELIPSDHPIVKGGMGKPQHANIFDFPSLTDIMAEDEEYIEQNPIFRNIN